MKAIILLLFFSGCVSTIDAKIPDRKLDFQLIASTYEEYEQQYLKIVEKADEYYRGREYEKALEFYKRALILRKNDKHVIKRIRKIERKLS
ncbi:MAG: hypothetical protein A3E30_02745 [Fluviicola sp. RIFCSPHIGHO2_12_FULL_43_24]|nr:MAG: hypothetical protein CHH17_08475 [Candidatus Fluviicola riflensis]OGS89841.1 MAG: hypothetical protein A3E30_02745 [Fluviicola sp. RIFCSPHIGHO2_12_FULL_43_24]